MSDIQNTMVVGGYKGCFRVNALAECVIAGGGANVGDVALFSIRASIPDKGLNIDLSNIMATEKDEQDIHTCTGEYAATNAGAVKVEAKTFDVTIGDDFSQLINDLSPEQYRDVFKAIISGGTFKDGNGAVWTVIGTNGQRWIGTINPETDLDHMYLFYLDGKLSHPSKKDALGNPFLYENGKAKAYNDRALIDFELKYTFSSNKKTGYRIAYALNTKNTFNEGSGSDINKHQLSFTRLCDIKNIEEYLVDGASYPKAITDTGDAIEVNVNYIANTTAPAVANVGEVAFVIDGAGLGKFQTYDGTVWNDTVETITLVKGTKIFGKDEFGNKVIAVIKDPGTKQTARFGSSYILKVKDFDYATMTFADYIGE